MKAGRAARAILRVFPISGELKNKAADFLHPAERMLLRAVGPARRREWLSSRAACKALAAHFWPRLRPDQVLTASSAAGPPCLLAPDGRSLFVSVAHDGAFLLAAASDRSRIGVDLQAPDERCLRLGQRYASPPFRSARSATIWWVALEAAAKCTGISLDRLMRKAILRGRGRLRTLAWPGGRVRVEIFSCRGRPAALAWRRRVW